MAEDYVVATQQTIGTLISKPKMADKYLKKPPFRFLHDLVMEVTRTTGFAQGLYNTEESDAEQLKEKGAKLDFLNKAISATCFALGETIDVSAPWACNSVETRKLLSFAVRCFYVWSMAEASKIVAGLEPEKTNAWLVKLHQAATSCVGEKSEAAVQRVLSGELIGAAKEKKKKPKEEGAPGAPPPPPEGPAEEAPAAPSADDEAKKEEERKRRAEKKKREEERKRKEAEAAAAAAAAAEPEQPPPEPPAPPQDDEEERKKEEKRRKEEERKRRKEEEKRRLQDDPCRLVWAIGKAPRIYEAAKPVSKWNPNNSEEEEQRRQEEAAEAAREEERRAAEEAQAAMAHAGMQDDGFQDAPPAPPGALSEGPASGPDEIAQRAQEMLAQQRAADGRPRTAGRKPPKVTSKVTTTEQSTAPTNVPAPVVITEGAAEEEEDMFEAGGAPPGAPPPPPPPTDDGGQHGALVSDLLAEKRKEEERERLKKEEEDTREEFDDGTKGIKMKLRRKKDTGSAMVEVDPVKLGEAIQSLCQAANPLGKSIDLVHQDIANMGKELDHWKQEYREASEAYGQQLKMTEDLLQPLYQKIAELDDKIAEQQAKIRNSRSRISKNDLKVQQLLESVVMVR